MHIASKPQGWHFRAKRIAEEMIGVSEGTVEKYLRELEDKKFLKRNKDPTSNRRTYELFFKEADYNQNSIFDSCLNDDFDAEYSVFAYYLKEHDSRFRQKHKPLKDRQIKKDCSTLNELARSGELNNDMLKSYVSEFLEKKGKNTDYHFPVFVHFILGELDDIYRGHQSGGVFSKEERKENLGLL